MLTRGEKIVLIGLTVVGLAFICQLAIVYNQDCGFWAPIPFLSKCYVMGW